MKMSALEASVKTADVDHGQRAREAEKAAQRIAGEHQYARALVLRYLELEDQHEALFPALAAAFKLTQQEVQRMQAAQQLRLLPISKAWI